MNFSYCCVFHQAERILSFIPPDGNFRLMSYHIGAQNVVGIPIYIRHNISFKDIGGGRLDITVGPRQTLGRTVSVSNYPSSTIFGSITLMTLICR